LPTARVVRGAKPRLLQSPSLDLSRQCRFRQCWFRQCWHIASTAVAWLSLLGVVCLATSAPAQQRREAADRLTVVPSLPLATFQNSLGVNTHIEYTDGKYADADKVLADLDYIGIRNVRDYIPNPAAWLPPGQALRAMQMLAAHGIRFDFVADGNASLPIAMQQLDALLRAEPGVALAVEGPNEIDNFPVKRDGKPSAPAAEAFQRALYQAVHTDPLLRGVPVLYMTGAAPVNLDTEPGLADIANTHPYPHRGEQPYSWLGRGFPLYFTMPGHYAKQITETGYYTLPASTDPGGVDADSQAMLILNAYFDAALEGNGHTYLYQLLDAYADPKQANSDDHYGLFALDGKPKPIARALHRMAQVLPPATPSSQQTVRAFIEGLPATAHTLALTASDGTVILFFWNEVPVWDPQTHTAIRQTAVKIHVTLPGSWSASSFSPLDDIFAVPTPLLSPDADGAYEQSLTPYPVAVIFRKK
jgi:hypothetical protein